MWLKSEWQINFCSYFYLSSVEGHGLLPFLFFTSVVGRSSHKFVEPLIFKSWRIQWVEKLRRFSFISANVNVSLPVGVSRFTFVYFELNAWVYPISCILSHKKDRDLALLLLCLLSLLPFLHVFLIQLNLLVANHSSVEQEHIHKSPTMSLEIRPLEFNPK